MINKCLVLVPHQDDETMLAGNAIHAMCKNNVEVFVLYSTNGDWKYSADLRIKEAEKALMKLGHIPKDHIILLGYGDTYNKVDRSHCFYALDIATQSVAGHTETYGASGIEDYRFVKSGYHSPYTKKSYVSDLKDVIKELLPDAIICVDADEHPDHRMLSLCFEDAMGQILKESSDYCPIVLKGFAYCNAYTAVDDFYEKQLHETRRPIVGETGKYTFDIIDTCTYKWDERIHIYGGYQARIRNLLRNSKAKALRQHKSQYVILKAGRIINSDEVFWLRRTNSLSYKADITVSSGEKKQLNDFKYYNYDEIDSINPKLENYLWCPQDDEKTATFFWKYPCKISECHIYGNIDDSGRIEKIRLSFDNGYEIETGPLPTRGLPLVIRIPSLDGITSCRLKIVEQVGVGCGISECEFYSKNIDDEILNEVLQFSDSPTIDIRENICIAKFINKLYLTSIKIDKLATRLYYLIKRKGIKGLIYKLFNGI